MKQWFSQFNQREQLSVLLLGLALALYLIYMMLWRPLEDLRDQMEVRNEGVASLLQTVDAMVSEILVLRDSGTSGGPKKNLMALINSSTSEAGLAVSRIQPNSRGEIQVRIEGETFDELLAWMHVMELRESLLVREVAITQSGTAGRVNATIRIAQGG